MSQREEAITASIDLAAIRLPQQSVPNAAAYHIGFESGILYGFYDIFRFFRYLYLNHIYPLLQKSHTLIAL